MMSYQDANWGPFGAELAQQTTWQSAYNQNIASFNKTLLWRKNVIILHIKKIIIFATSYKPIWFNILHIIFHRIPKSLRIITPSPPKNATPRPA